MSFLRYLRLSEHQGHIPVRGQRGQQRAGAHRGDPGRGGAQAPVQPGGARDVRDDNQVRQPAGLLSILFKI